MPYPREDRPSGIRTASPSGTDQMRFSFEMIIIVIIIQLHTSVAHDRPLLIVTNCNQITRVNLRFVLQTLSCGCGICKPLEPCKLYWSCCQMPPSAANSLRFLCKNALLNVFRHVDANSTTRSAKFKHFQRLFPPCGQQQCNTQCQI